MNKKPMKNDNNSGNRVWLALIAATAAVLIAIFGVHQKGPIKFHLEELILEVGKAEDTTRTPGTKTAAQAGTTGINITNRLAAGTSAPAHPASDITTANSVVPVK
jgi:hypothetical protein